MTTSPSDETSPEPRVSVLDRFADEVTTAVGGVSWSTDHQTVKVRVAADRWAEAVEAARDWGLPFFEFLSAIDWSNDVSVGDPPEEPVEERYEMLCAVGDITEGRLAILSADIPKDAASIASVTHVYPGAQWHEREAAEMFGIRFVGLDRTEKLYLPDEFEGYPLRKSFSLLSREVKPWPGDVDVEGIPGRGGDSSDGPSTENPEA